MPAFRTRAVILALLAIAAVILALLATAARIGTAGEARAVGFLTGIYLDRPEASGPESALVYKRVVAAGAQVVRFTISWRDIAPAARPQGWDPSDPGDPNYDWGDIDSKIEQAVMSGLTPLVTVLGAPQWAQVGDVAEDSSSYRPNPAALASFARAVARRYDGHFRGLPRVRHWQVWNEPNITSYLLPQFANGRDVSPYWYRRMVNAFADAVHGVAPDNLVVAGGLSPFTVNYPDVKSIGPLRFMRELLCMSGGSHPHPTCGTKVKFDIWAHHPYTTGGPFHSAVNPNDVSLGDLPRMRALLAAAQTSGHIESSRRVGFWVTEFSWDSKPPDPKGVSVGLVARWTSEALYQMWRSGVSVVIWLMLRDDLYPNSPLQAGFYYRGNTVAGDRPKPSLAAFRYPFVAYLRGDGVYVWGRTPASRAGVVAVERRDRASGPWRRVATLSTDRYGLFSRTLRIRATSKTWLRARLVGSNARTLPFSLTEPADRMVRPFG